MKGIIAFVVALLLGGGLSAAWAVDPWAGCDFLTAGTNVTITCPNTTTGGATISTAASAGVTVNGTANQINTTSASILLGGSATLSLSSTLVAPGALTVTTRSGTPSTLATFDSGGKLVAGASYSTSVNYRTCTIIIGADNGAVLVDTDLGPQGKQCFLPAAATVIEIVVAADGGTPSVLPRRINASGSAANLLSGALATAAAGAVACSNAGGTTGIDGITTCTNTLQNTSASAGVWLELLSGTAGGVAKRMSIAIIYTIP